MTAKFCVLDIETTGLDTSQDEILEVGAILFDESMAEIDRYHSYVNDSAVVSRVVMVRDIAGRNPEYSPDLVEQIESAKLVVDMHRASGLFGDILNASYGRGYQEFEESFGDWLYAHGMRDAQSDEKKGAQVHLVGSSLHFDTDFLNKKAPSIIRHFNHRRCDVSAFKVIVDRFMPDAAAKRKDELNPKSAHRALSDCVDTMNEFNWYAKTFSIPAMATMTGER